MGVDRWVAIEVTLAGWWHSKKRPWMGTKTVAKQGGGGGKEKGGWSRGMNHKPFTTSSSLSPPNPDYTFKRRVERDKQCKGHCLGNRDDLTVKAKVDLERCSVIMHLLMSLPFFITSIITLLLNAHIRCQTCSRLYLFVFFFYTFTLLFCFA